jgi:hypothetical protein
MRLHLHLQMRETHTHTHTAACRRTDLQLRDGPISRVEGVGKMVDLTAEPRNCQLVADALGRGVQGADGL